eukprot:435253_1
MSRNIANRRRTRSGIKMWVGIVICLVLLSCFPEEIMSFSPGVEQLRRTDMLSRKGLIIPAVPPNLSARPTRTGFCREQLHMSQTLPRPIMSGLVQAEMNSQGQKVQSMELSAKNSEPEETGRFMKAYLKYTNTFTNFFPLWLTMFSLIALKSPASFAWFTTNYFTAALAVLMLSMGITLSPQDFVNVLRRPNAVLLGFLLCYGMMPALAYTLAMGAGLSPPLLAGLVLVGCINGGQASNLCTYIANGNVALSVMMTTATTIGAIFCTPLLCKAMLGTVVPVDAVGIAKSTLQVVLAPIAVGMGTNKFFPKACEKIVPITPVVGVISTCFLVASAVAQVAPDILSAGLTLQIPIILLHLIGGLAGFLIPRVLGFSEKASRTMAIETAMKSSAFGFLLAQLHFGHKGVRVPSAVSVVWMAITGSLLAVYWRYQPIKTPPFDRGIKERYDRVNFMSILKRAFKKDSPMVEGNKNSRG